MAYNDFNMDYDDDDFCPSCDGEEDQPCECDQQTGKRIADGDACAACGGSGCPACDALPDEEGEG